VPAGAATDEVVDGDTVAERGSFDARRLLDDDAGDFVAGSQRQARPPRILPVVRVGVADPARADLDQDFAGGRRRVGEIFVTESLTRSSESNGAHGRIIARARRRGLPNLFRRLPLGFPGASPSGRKS
jgi:hypothetical protein